MEGERSSMRNWERPIRGHIHASRPPTSGVGGL
jgi:hypothetical protein